MNSERYQATLALIDRLEEVKNKSMGPHDAQAALNDFAEKPDPDGPWHAEVGFCGGIAAPVADLAALLQEVFAAGVVKGSLANVMSEPPTYDRFINDALTLAGIEAPSPAEARQLLDVAWNLCKCGSQMRPGGAVCSSDPAPPKCGKCHHSMSHGACPMCEPKRFTERTGQTP